MAWKWNYCIKFVQMLYEFVINKYSISKSMTMYLGQTHAQYLQEKGMSLYFQYSHLLK